MHYVPCELAEGREMVRFDEVGAERAVSSLKVEPAGLAGVALKLLHLCGELAVPLNPLVFAKTLEPFRFEPCLVVFRFGTQVERCLAVNEVPVHCQESLQVSDKHFFTG